MKKQNRLGESKSPYLLQHKDNPVHWYSWGPEAFEAARLENKPIFLSIGYSTCYWCHMMEKDSFEIQEVADVLNKYFISIKVDREEHPDVDQIYMDAVIGMTGQGGWPMSVFLTPYLKPFSGGTFFWKAQFLTILSRIQEIWSREPDKILEQAKELTYFLKEKGPSVGTAEVNEALLQPAFRQLRENFDSAHGGFGGAPKFPQSMNFSFLLRYYQRFKEKDALEMVTQTLDAMAAGEIFDKIGGGFHRYATQVDWNEPHYEKMLYDNALLVSVYLEAFVLTQNQKYADVARRTLDFVLAELSHPKGGFYSALDAGEVGKEGEYYHLSKEERQKVQPPARDEKILTSWNGLMIAAFAKGYQVLGDEKYLKTAQAAAHFIREKLFQNGELLRRFCDGDSRFPGTLDDYTFFIHGLLALHESDPHSWLDWAKEIQKKQDEIFWDEKETGYFFSDPKDPSLIVAKKEFHDGALPAGNSIAAVNLLSLSTETCEEYYFTKTENLLKRLAAESVKYPAGFATGLIAVDRFLNQPLLCR